MIRYRRQRSSCASFSGYLACQDTPHPSAPRGAMPCLPCPAEPGPRPRPAGARQTITPLRPPHALEAAPTSAEAASTRPTAPPTPLDWRPPRRASATAHRPVEAGTPPQPQLSAGPDRRRLTCLQTWLTRPWTNRPPVRPAPAESSNSATFTPSTRACSVTASRRASGTSRTCHATGGPRFSVMFYLFANA